MTKSFYQVLPLWTSVDLGAMDGGVLYIPQIAKI